MEGTGKTVKSSRERQEGVGKRRTDQMSSVGRNVSTLVVGVNGNVQSHQVDELLILSVSEQSSQVGRVILVGVDSGEFTIAVDVSEDSTSDSRELGDEVHGVVESRLPVFSLVDTLRVCLGEGRVVVQLDASAITLTKEWTCEWRSLTAVTAREN